MTPDAARLRPLCPLRRWAASLAACALVAATATATAAAAAPQSSMAARELRPEHRPAWADAPVLRELVLDRDPLLGDVANGARLLARVQTLLPGDRLTVGPGRWSVAPLFTVTLAGTAQAPIRIEARAGATPILTRPDPFQNVVNFGGPGGVTARYLLVRGLEITGGSYGVRIERGQDLWLDACHVHHTGADGIRASDNDSARLYFTRCEVAYTSRLNGTGEGLYIGANGAAAVARDAVIALNHIHHTGGSQGDGIELKQGSFGCVVAENVVHDTLYPGILLYGTGGGARNVVEGNLIWGTIANPFQVQGEALVRNNVVFGGANAAFISFDHQGQVRDLEVVHNTFIAAAGDAARLQHWSNRPGMLLANNALYSESGTALNCLSGAQGVTIVGNVVHGPTWSDGGAVHVIAHGLSDFVDVRFDGSRRDAHPSATSALQNAATLASVAHADQTGAERAPATAAGALEVGTYGRYLGASSGAPAGTLGLRSSALPVAGGAAISVTLERGTPGNFAVIGVVFTAPDGSPLPGVPLVQRQVAMLDASGRMSISFAPPIQGLAARVRLVGVARDVSAPGGIARTQWVEWLF